ncbi:EEF1A lysine methyltransferase 4 [Coccomyxa sp. Obi]|nr:EEF1A lysine methyltransferase 4 [Coccomyxa sp. Obi]
MSSDLLSEDFKKIQEAEREIVRAVDVAGEVIKELAKLGEADQGVVEQKSNEFLGIVKGVQGVLLPATAKFAKIIPDERNKYRLHAQAAEQPSFLPDHNARYLDAKYWDERFQKEEEYDWFKGYKEFAHLVTPHLQPSSKILILGCGNSSLTADLFSDGFQRITSVDLSPAVIDRMRTRAAEKGMGSIEWRVADMLDLPFSDGSFDAVIEKGTMDVLFVDNDSPWSPRPEVCTRVHRMLAETHRVLSADGVFVSVTFAQPHFRRPFLQAPQYSWGMHVATFGEGFHYFVYAMRKGTRAETEGAERDAGVAEGIKRVALKESPMHEHMEQDDYLLRMSL